MHLREEVLIFTRRGESHSNISGTKRAKEIASTTGNSYVILVLTFLLSYFYVPRPKSITERVSEDTFDRDE